jgi:hypothetical protein
MNTLSRRLRPLGALTLVVAVTVVAAACADGAAIGIGTQQIAMSADTVQGTASVSELQQRRAAWVARGITDYRVQLRVVCFCGSEVTRPVVVEVRGGAVAKVTDLETGTPATALTTYPTVTGLFDAAIAERTRGGFVSVAYDTAAGLPVRLEVGTLANDAGVQYQVSGLTPL